MVVVFNFFLFFLNGVCRHELEDDFAIKFVAFLNGVCRHEHNVYGFESIHLFLNGVCRHEHMQSMQV